MPMNPQATVTGVKGLDYGALNLEALLAIYEDHHRAALGQAKAVAERRLSEGRKLSDTTLAVLERLRALSEDGAAELLRLSTTPPTRDEERLRRQRKRSGPWSTPTSGGPACASSAACTE